MTPQAINPALLPPGGLHAPAGPAAPGRSTPAAQPGSAPRFADALDRASGDVRFSRHALERVRRRGIDVGAAAQQRLATALDRAHAKGSRDAVVLLDGTAFVVSVPNRTVITAVDPEHMREQVFTNIDAAVIG